MVNVPYNLTDGDGNTWVIDAYGNASSGPVSTGGSNGYTTYDSDPDLSRDQRQLTFGPTSSFSDVEVSRRVYVAEDEGFVRFYDSFTNTGDTTLTHSSSRSHPAAPMPMRSWISIPIAMRSGSIPMPTIALAGLVTRPRLPATGSDRQGLPGHMT